MISAVAEKRFSYRCGLDESIPYGSIWKAVADNNFQHFLILHFDELLTF